MEQIKALEQEWRAFTPHFGDRELAQIFPEAEEVIRELIVKTFGKLLNARARIYESYLHSLRVKETKPVCEAVAEIINKNEVQPFKKRLNRLLFQHRVFVEPNYKINRIDSKKIKERVDLKQFVESSGVKLRKKGRTWQGCCPFHSEKTGSFTIFPDNHFFCFGCGEKGDIFDFIQKRDNCDFKQALSLLKNYA